jgi:hypothetical protein
MMWEMEPPSPENQDESFDYAKWSRTENKFWGKVNRRDGFWFIVLLSLLLLWRVFDYPRHAAPST